MSTPMLEQYDRIKARHRDAILLFRLGDFYEMFGEDAREGSRILGLTLTRRQNLPMCGVPHHAATSYIHRLLHAGRKVAICEQTSPPDGKNLTTREVVEVLSPGAVFDLDYLDPRRSNYLLAIAESGGRITTAWCDISTGELGIAASAPTEDPEQVVRRELARVAPSEVLVQESLLETSATLAKHSSVDSSLVVNRIPDWGFNRDDSLRRLTAVLGVVSLAGFGIEEDDPALTPVSALLDYLEDNARHVLRHISDVRRHRDTERLLLDDSTIRNLELLENLQDRGAGYTLIAVLDECSTAMGSRLLRRELVAPPRDCAAVEARLERVSDLYHRQSELQALRQALADVHDLERLVGRLGVEKAHPKDVLGIARTIAAAEAVGQRVRGWFAADAPPPGSGTSHEIGSYAPDQLSLFDDHPEHAATLHELAADIVTTLDDEPAVALNEGGIIRPGRDAELDELRALRTDSRRILDAYLDEQRERTGVGSLKIKHNRVLGHFFELPSAQAGRLPEEFVRRQSLASVERFTTTRLAELEDQINNAAEQADAREQQLFLELRARVAERIPLLTELARRLAAVDMAAGLAHAATRNGWVRPQLETRPMLAIDGGRHPVVEYHLPPGDFVENDIALDPEGERFLLITGPNMAGKSTVLRQTALIMLMTHLGSFVPARTARLGLADRIFCRVGASDNIARGESTFLVEMNETSNILRNATEQSLVIMDEVGRGTSTHDGLAIAWAVSEHLLNHVGARTLFATHYHELAALRHPHFGARGMAVEHSAERIIFLKKLRAGAGDRSYGIDVARMAGLPDAVITRARTILAGLEEQAPGPASGSAPAADAGPSEAPAAGEEADAANGSPADRDSVELFTPQDYVLAELGALDPDTLSPREALEIIYRLRERLRERRP